MKLLKVILAINLLFVSVGYAQKENATIKAGKSYKQSGVKMFSPNEAGWQIVKSESSETIFGKTGSDKKFNVFVRTKAIPDAKNTEDLLEYLEKMKETELDMANRDSLHFNRMNYKDTPCIQYDGIFNNDISKVPGYKYFSFNGYLCQHPNDKNVVIQTEFSEYSNSRGFSEAESKLSKEFHEKIKFVKVGKK